VIYATGYHLQRLVFFYTTSTLGRWTNPSDVSLISIRYS
jgi:hypothetical protein